MYSSGKCSNCNKQAEQDETRLVTGQTSITNSLLDIIEDNEPVSGVRLKNLEREHVGDFLRKALHWRVVVVRILLVIQTSIGTDFASSPVSFHRLVWAVL